MPPKLKAVLINAGRLDFDAKLNLAKLSEVCDVTRYDDSSPTQAEIGERANGHDMVISKARKLCVFYLRGGSRH